MKGTLAVHYEPFSTLPHAYHVKDGETLETLSRRVKSLPPGWPRHDGDQIHIDGHPVPPAIWGIVKPKPNAVTQITFHAPPMGGGGDSGKQVLGLVASIGLLAISGGVSSLVFGKLAAGGMAVGKATLLGRLAGAAVVLAGSAVIQALTPTPSVPRRDSSDTREPLGAASAQGNVLEPNASMPRVVGTRKVFPPFVTEPLVYYDGQDEVAEVACGLSGPHDMAEIRVGDALIDDVDGVEYETREGWSGDEEMTLLSRYGRTYRDGTLIQGHVVNEENKNAVEREPSFKAIATRSGPDEFWMGLLFQQGLAITTSPDTELRVPFRIRMRQRGSPTWTNLPELHFNAAILGPRRATIKFEWTDIESDAAAGSTKGWVEARVSAENWTANSYFDADTGGDEYITSGNLGDSDVLNVIANENEVTFRLNESTFPKDVYELEIKRGYAFKESDYSASTYQIGGAARDPFSSENDTIYQTKKDLVDEVSLTRYSSVWNEKPVRGGDTAIIQIRTRNVSLDRVSTLASGYVLDWDGSAWNTWTTTSNPAPHLRDVFVGRLNATPLPEAVVDDDAILDWRSAAWECNAILQDVSVEDAANIICGTGYAQLYQADKFGVVRDRDRSADSPVQIFTPSNTVGVSWSRGYPKRPDGFRATFVDANRDYETRQIIHPEDAARTEQVTIEGLVSESDVRDRLQYDLDSSRLRSVFYTWDAPADAIVCRRGSLVGLSSDVLSKRASTGRVADYEINDSDEITAIRLENEPDLTAEFTWGSITDLGNVGDIGAIGATYGIAIRRKGETVSVHEVTSSSLGDEWVDLVTPAVLTGLSENDLAAIGPLGQEYRRLIVVSMDPKSLTEWTLTAVPEAPELWQ